MKYKQQVTDRIDSAIQKVDITVRGMQSRTMNAEEILAQLEVIKRTLESINELVELE